MFIGVVFVYLDPIIVAMGVSWSDTSTKVPRLRSSNAMVYVNLGTDELIFVYVFLSPYYFYKSHRDPNPAVWLDPGLSKLGLYFWGGSSFMLLARITLDKPSYLLRYRS